LPKVQTAFVEKLWIAFGVTHCVFLNLGGFGVAISLPMSSADEFADLVPKEKQKPRTKGQPLREAKAEEHAVPSGGGTEQLREGLEESFQSRILPQILDGVEERLASRFESRLQKLEGRAERVEIIGHAVYELRQGQLKSHNALQSEVSLLLARGWCKIGS